MSFFFQVDALERDAFEVLRMIRAMKNLIAPINRIPPEVLSQIPDYCDDDSLDKTLIALTHVCHDWREMFISIPSLWTSLKSNTADKTRTYLKRSKPSPINVYIVDERDVDNPFRLIIPHVPRLKSLIIRLPSLPNIPPGFHCRAPLLETLKIDATGILDDALFNGDLSSLRELHLKANTSLPWRNMANLQVFNLRTYCDEFGTTQIFDFLESAPLLHTISLVFSNPKISDAPPERILHLPHLKKLNVKSEDSHLTILKHFKIPVGASLTSKFYLSDDVSPLSGYLHPETSPVLHNLSHITKINLLYNPTKKFTQLIGPNGCLRVIARRGNSSTTFMNDQIRRSLPSSMLSTTQSLTFSWYNHKEVPKIEECPIFQTLSSANDLRTLSLVSCNQNPFFIALDPGQNPSNPVRCLNLKKLVLYSVYGSGAPPNVKLLIEMAKNRASRGAKLSSVTLVTLKCRVNEKKVLKLREHVTHLEYRNDVSVPDWDTVFDEGE